MPAFPQMLVVEEPIASEDTLRNQALNVDEFIWPHGVTPPLHHVRKRRFRKRINRRVGESFKNLRATPSFLYRLSRLSSKRSKGFSRKTN